VGIAKQCSANRTLATTIGMYDFACLRHVLCKTESKPAHFCHNPPEIDIACQRRVQSSIDQPLNRAVDNEWDLPEFKFTVDLGHRSLHHGVDVWHLGVTGECSHWGFLEIFQAFRNLPHPIEHLRLRRRYYRIRQTQFQRRTQFIPCVAFGEDSWLARLVCEIHGRCELRVVLRDFTEHR
jgi:hypothetical protein